MPSLGIPRNCEVCSDLTRDQNKSNDLWRHTESCNYVPKSRQSGLIKHDFVIYSYTKYELSKSWEHVRIRKGNTSQPIYNTV